MNRIFVKLNEEEKLVGEFRKNRQTETLSENEVVNILKRVSKNDVKVYVKKLKTDNYPTLRIIDNGKVFNVVIENHKLVFDRAKEVLKERRNKKAFVASIAGVATLFGLAAGTLAFASAHKNYDPVEDQKVSEEEMLENTQTILAITDEQVYTGDTFRIELDNNSVYDKGIEERNEPFIDILKEQSEKYGVSYNLLYDIVSQEYGGDEDSNNICHVVFSSWEDQILSAYNFETNQVEYIVLTNTPEQYQIINEDRSNAGQPYCVDETITQAELNSNADKSVKVCQFIMNDNVRYFRGNNGLTIQAYNNGRTAVNRIIDTTAEATGVDRDVIIDEKDAVYWLKYRNIGQKGDPNYLYNVAKHESVEGDNTNTYSIKYMGDDGQIHEDIFCFTNEGLNQIIENEEEIIENEEATIEQGIVKGR